MCILSGCDYLSSIPGVGLGRASKLMKKFNCNPYKVSGASAASACAVVAADVLCPLLLCYPTESSLLAGLLLPCSRLSSSVLQGN